MRYIANIATIRNMIVVQWPSVHAKQVEAWRLLDLAGLTTSVRHSRNYTQAGFGYVNGNSFTMRTKVPVGEELLLELLFPNGKIIRKRIFVANKYYRSRPARSNEPTTLYYKK